MKKVALFFAFAVACVSGTFAQKQTGGEKNFEVQFAPLGGNPVSISGIRFRMFNTESSAFRIGLFVGGTKDVTVNTQPGQVEQDQPELLTTDRSFNFSIRPGYEKHFAGTDRLSPYIGGELLIGLGRTSTETEKYGDASFDNGAQYSVWTTTEKNGTFDLGVNILFGTDFYFADNIYLGAEFGFGLLSSKENDGEFEVSDTDAYKIENGIPDATEVKFDPTINGRNSSWGPNYQGTIRLGWLFN